MSATRASAVGIRVLGGFEITVDGERVVTGSIGRRDADRMAKFLSLGRGRKVHREQLIDALWPDVPLGAVANRLHKAAHFVRKAVGVADAMVLAGETVALFPHCEVTIDAVDFEQAAARAVAADGPEQRRLAAEAIDLYGGELLPHDPYEDWAFHHRQRLQLRYRELLRLTGRDAELVALDPTDEDGHVGLMRALLRGGDRSGVLRQFAVLAEILERELGVGPSVEACAVRDLALGPARGDVGLGAAAPSMPAPRRSRPSTSTSARPPTAFGSRTRRAAAAARW